jgi:predicted ATPase with chaperone activity
MATSATHHGVVPARRDRDRTRCHRLVGVKVSSPTEKLGLPSFTIVGLTDRAIQEARERVRAAIRNAGFDFPMRRLTVNLAPAEIPKEGTGFDLAIATAILCPGNCTLRLGGLWVPP